MKEERLQLRIDAKLKSQAETLAKRQSITLSALIMQLLAQAVDADQLERTRNREEVDQV